MPRVLQQAITLDRAGGTPAHVLIERWFVDAIGTGDLASGDRLPSEQELAGRFGVSRMTLRQSLSRLEDLGLLRRTPGRSGGTFITEPKIECDLTGLAGFTEQMRRAHVRAGARVVEAATVAASRAVAAALSIDHDDEVHRIVRVRSANREPLALECSYFPARVFPDLLQRRLTGSLYGLLQREYGQAPHTALEYLDPVTATAAQAALLQVVIGSPLMRIERTAFTAAGLAVEFALDYFRTDRVRISVRSGLGSSGRA